jgi:hypothetical protein
MGTINTNTLSGDAAVMAFMDGDSGVTTARCAFGVALAQTTAGSGFTFGLDLKMQDPVADAGGPSGVIAYKTAEIRLADDAAVWTPPMGRQLVFTHDVLAAGIHYLPDDPPADVAWKLVAVNLSDLAAMAATPAGVLLGLGLSAAEDDAWREAFVAGLERALATFGAALWGGDTVSGLAQGRVTRPTRSLTSGPMAGCQRLGTLSRTSSVTSSGRS